MPRRLASLALGLAALTASTAVPAAPNDWVEGSANDEGATREFYNHSADLAWRQMLGDWADSTGADFGASAWNTQNVADTDTERWIEWDVTELVRGWLDGSFQNQGFFLRATSGNGPIDFRSRDAAETEHPELVIEAGSSTTLSPEADTYLEPSTYRGQGTEDRLRVSDENNTLVRFDLAGIDAAALTSARLRLYTTRQFGGGADVGVFRAVPGRAGPPPALQSGIAEPFDKDQGLASHPDVVFFEDFEAADWEDHWTSHGGSYDIADGDPAFGFEPLVGRALRSWIPQGENTGLNTRYDFQDETGSEPEEIYLRYYLRLGDDWNQTVDGGKLPGISGTYGVAGWGGRKSDGTNGWSARGLFHESVPAGANPLALATPVGSYVYHADMPGTFGDNFIWVEGWGQEGYGGVLRTGVWYCLEYYVKMNTLTQNDGIIRAWVDGRLSFEKTDFRFRDVDSLKIERIWMNIYHGGTDVSPYDQHAFIDHVVVATSYIGLMTGGPTPPGPGGAGGMGGMGGMAGSGSGGDGAAGSGGSGGSSTSGGAAGNGQSGSNGSGTSNNADGSGDEGGCGCRAAGSPRPFAPGGMIVGVALLLARKRRRQRPPSGGERRASS